MAFKVPEKYRIKSALQGKFASDASYGNNGAFLIPTGNKMKTYYCVASDGQEWEHVSVTIRMGKKTRMPTWEEMCKIKDLFWGPEDCVVQYHPPVSEYVNNHPHCLHLWRPIDQEVPRPAWYLVGFK